MPSSLLALLRVLNRRETGEESQSYHPKAACKFASVQVCKCAATTTCRRGAEIPPTQPTKNNAAVSHSPQQPHTISNSRQKESTGSKKRDRSRMLLPPPLRTLQTNPTPRASSCTHAHRVHTTNNNRPANQAIRRTPARTAPAPCPGCRPRGPSPCNGPPAGACCSKTCPTPTRRRNRSLRRRPRNRSPTCRGRTYHHHHHRPSMKDRCRRSRRIPPVMMCELNTPVGGGGGGWARGTR